jgi:hypothetical protein
MAAEGMQFSWRWNGGTISLNLEDIWEMSEKSAFLFPAQKVGLLSGKSLTPNLRDLPRSLTDLNQ